MTLRVFLPLLLLLTLTAAQAGAPSGTPANPAALPGAPPPPLPWFDEVRDQRRAASALRRAGHAAQQDARLDEFLRRRQERRELVEQERWLFLNAGPWLEPLTQPPAARPGASSAAADDPQSPVHPPPGWDNRWYFNGW